jgi:hypothetical protein
MVALSERGERRRVEAEKKDDTRASSPDAPSVVL